MSQENEDTKAHTFFWMVFGWVLMAEDLAKYTGKSSLELRKKYLQLGRKKFKTFSTEQVQQFMEENYPG